MTYAWHLKSQAVLLENWLVWEKPPMLGVRSVVSRRKKGVYLSVCKEGTDLGEDPSPQGWDSDLSGEGVAAVRWTVERFAEEPQMKPLGGQDTLLGSVFWGVTKASGSCSQEACCLLKNCLLGCQGNSLRCEHYWDWGFLPRWLLFTAGARRKQGDGTRKRRPFFLRVPLAPSTDEA